MPPSHPWVRLGHVKVKKPMQLTMPHCHSDPYIEAIQQPNVSVHFTGVERLTEDGIVGNDGIERKVDSVICASGELDDPIYSRLS